MSTATQTAPQTRHIAEQATIPGTNLVTTAPTQGVVVLIDENVQKGKFLDIFKLEGEVVGQTRSKVSKKGAVRFDLKTAKEIGETTGLKGDALKAHVQELGRGLKGEMAKGIVHLATDPNWVGRHITMGAAGDTITFQLKKVVPVVVTQKAIAAPELTNEQLAATLGVPVEVVVEMKADKARKDEEAAELAKLEAEEAAKATAATA